jgi:putative inorganic carbon (HCO3(-)) transporter
MPFKPKIVDYEPVFPSRARRDSDFHAQPESWPSSDKFDSFDNPAIKPAAPVNEEAANNTTLLTTSADWIRRKGHTISFSALFVFTIILYFRPYELIPGLSSFKSMAFYVGIVTLAIYAITELAVEGNLTARTREINLALLLGVAALLSIPFAINPGEAWKTFSELLVKALLIFIVIVNVVRTKHRLYLMIMLALVVSVYLSIYAIQDYQSGIFGIGEAETLRIKGRIHGLFDNPNDLALHLVSIAPIAVGLAFAKRGMWTKFVYLGAAFLMVAAVVVTFSRGGFIGLVAVSFFLLWRLGRKQRGLSMAVFVLLIVFFFAFAPGSYGSRLSTIFNTASDITGSASQRNQVLKRSIFVTLRYPLLGVGLGNFHYKSFQELGTHNAYTQVGSEMGIPAMVLYIMFLVYPYKRLKEIEKATDGNKNERYYYYLSIGLRAGLIGYMVASFFAAVAYQWYIWYLVGYAIALRRIYLAHTQKVLSPAGQTPPAKPAEVRSLA